MPDSSLNIPSQRPWYLSCPTPEDRDHCWILWLEQDEQRTRPCLRCGYTEPKVKTDD